MYTANILEIDGLKVITGIDKKGIEQVETEKKIAPYLQESSEQKAIEARQNQIKVYVKNIEAVTHQEKQLLFIISSEKGIPVNLIKDEHLTFSQREQFQRYKEKKDFNKAQISELQKSFIDLNRKKEEKRLELIKKYAVYFETPAGQIDLEEKQAIDFNKKLCMAVEYFNTRKKKKVLLLTGELIDDLRGKVAWNKVDDRWSKRTIQFLHEKLDITEILEDDLIDEQKLEITKQEESDRIANMTQEEKDAMLNQKMTALLKQSIAMRSELEILGDTEALKKARDWYQEQVKLL